MSAVRSACIVANVAAIRLALVAAAYLMPAALQKRWRDSGVRRLKFPIRIDFLLSPFMLFIGATASNSYVELADDVIRLRFGPTFDHTIARADVAAAAPMSWSIFDGFGVRAGGQIVGLIGSMSGVVELKLRQPVTFRYAAWPWTVERVAISLEEPEAFLNALRDAPTAHEAVIPAAVE